ASQPAPRHRVFEAPSVEALPPPVGFLPCETIRQGLCGGSSVSSTKRNTSCYSYKSLTPSRKELSIRGRRGGGLFQGTFGGTRKFAFAICVSARICAGFRRLPFGDFRITT